MKSLTTLKIFFMGTPLFASHILAYLVESGIPVHTVITQPDKPVGRKKELIPSEVKTYALQKGIPLMQFERIDEAAMDFFRSQAPDLLIVAAYGIILPKSLITLPRFGCINVHASLLPKLRGASPIQTALLQGLDWTGTTVMLMDEKMDTGDILAQEVAPIVRADTYETLERKLLDSSCKILIPTLAGWVSGILKPRPQDHAQATYTTMITKQDGLISWALPAIDIYHRYQAFYRWPKIYAFWDMARDGLPSQGSAPSARKKITFHEIDMNDTISTDRQPGVVFRLADGNIAIQTSKGVIIPKTIQLDGKTPVPVRSFLNGYPQFIGSLLP